jgi:hypothetical protein
MINHLSLYAVFQACFLLKAVLLHHVIIHVDLLTERQLSPLWIGRFIKELWRNLIHRTFPKEPLWIFGSKE